MVYFLLTSNSLLDSNLLQENYSEKSGTDSESDEIDNNIQEDIVLRKRVPSESEEIEVEDHSENVRNERESILNDAIHRIKRKSKCLLL